MGTTPMTPDQLIAALRAEGVKVMEHTGWRGHGRPGDWGPVHGSMLHHTAIATAEASVRVCFEGRPDLAGPLSHGVIDREGTVHLVGSGRANHAGTGSSSVLAAAVNGLPVPAKPGPDNTSGNAHFYGWEAVNRGDGRDPWPEAQLDAIVRVQAAVCRHHGWTAEAVVAHKEWTGRKIDPHGLDMEGLRDKVAARLVTTVKPAPKPKPPAPKWPGVYLKRGSTGTHVKTWQKKLGITADGIFGPRTEAATEALQRKHKLKVDGVVGPLTWRAAFK